MLTNDMKEKLEAYRREVVDNTVTREELTEAVRIMRSGRLSAASAKATKVSKAKEAVIDSDSLLDEFLG